MRGYSALVLVISAVLSGCAGRGGHTPEDANVASDSSRLERLPAGHRIVPLTVKSEPETWLNSPVTVLRSAVDVKARAAYDVSVYGRGIVVAVVDTGVDAAHPVFGGRVLPGWNAFDGTSDARDGQGHGTHVAGTIAGQAVPDLNLFEQVGVAPATHILPVRVTDTDGKFPSTAGADMDVVAGGLIWASERAHVINMSVSNDNANLRGNWADCNQGGEQARSWICAARAVATNGAVLVVASGNKGYGQSQSKESGYKGFGTWASSTVLNGQMLVVGSVVPQYSFTSTGAAATDSKGDLVVKSWGMSKFTDVPGQDVEKQKWFLVAPGEDVRSATANSFQTTPFSEDTGTSMAAPLVSGAAALLLEKWPFLPAPDVVDILLRSASDLGKPGMDPVFGRGLLNIAGAMSPLGQLRIPSGETLSGAAVAADSAVASPSAVGSALEHSAVLTRVMALDEYQRDFYVDLTVKVVHAKPGVQIKPIADRAPAVLGEMGGVNWTAQSTLWSPQHVLAWNDSRITTFGRSHSGMPFVGDRPLVTTSLVMPRLRLSVVSTATETPAWSGFAAERFEASKWGALRSYGAYLRDDGLFGTQGVGAWALGRSHTAAAGFGMHSELGAGWMLDADLHAGVTNLSQSGELFTGGRVLSRANSMGLTWQGMNNLAGFSWQQPLRVERGGLSGSIPVARTTDGRVVRENFDLTLKPDGQENNIEAFWQGHVGKRSYLRLNVACRWEPDHIRAADALVMVGLLWESRWR